MKTKTHPENTKYLVWVDGLISPCGTKVAGMELHDSTLWQYEVNYMGYIASEKLVGKNQIDEMKKNKWISEVQFKQLIFRGATKINEDKPKNRKRIDITIPASMIEFLTREGQIRQCSKSAVIEEALTEYIERKKK